MKDTKIKVDGIDVLVTTDKNHTLSNEEIKHLEKIITKQRKKIDNKFKLKERSERK